MTCKQNTFIIFSLETYLDMIYFNMFKWDKFHIKAFVTQMTEKIFWTMDVFHRQQKHAFLIKLTITIITYTMMLIHICFQHRKQS